jgi:hypothetical protein
MEEVGQLRKPNQGTAEGEHGCSVGQVCTCRTPAHRAAQRPWDPPRLETPHQSASWADRIAPGPPAIAVAAHAATVSGWLRSSAWDLAFLIDAQHDRTFRRREVNADYIAHSLDEQRVDRKLELINTPNRHFSCAPLRNRSEAESRGLNACSSY